MRDFLLGSADEEVFGAFRSAPSGVFESAGRRRSDSEMDQLILEAAETQLRADAMAAMLTWIDDADWTYDALDSLLIGLASDSDDEDEEDLSDDEAEHYEALTDAARDALVSLGGDEANVDATLDEDDDAASKLGQYLANRLDDVTKSDDDLVSEFAVGGEMVVESTRRVVRNGKTKRVRKKRRKKRQTAAQKASLRKARRKSNTSSARRSRKRSNRRRKSMGL